MEPLKIEAAHVFRVSISVKAMGMEDGEAVKESVVVNLISSSGVNGWGCACPIEEATGETAEAAIEAIGGKLEPALRGMPERPVMELLEAVENAAPEAPAARAAFDIALYDIWSKMLETPLVCLLGQCRTSIRTSAAVEISDPNTTVLEAGDQIENGYKIIKLKSGGDFAEDIESIEAVRRDYGRGVPLRFDACGGYTEEQAMELIEKTGDSLKLLEQPVAAGETEALLRICEKSPAPVVADESAVKPEEAAELLRLGVPVIKVKLMKHGGIWPSMRICDAARTFGGRVIVGCGEETPVSAAAAAHLALSRPSVEYADLEGRLKSGRYVVSSGMRVRDGVVTVAMRSGLGVEIRRNVLRR